MIFKVATAAAQQTGFPPKVVPWAPGGQDMIRAGAMTALRGMPLASGDALKLFIRVNDGGVIEGPPLAGAAHAGLNLVGHQTDAVVVADFTQAPEEGVGGHGVAALALDGFDEDGGHLPGRNHVPEDVLLDEVGVAEGGMGHRGKKGPESFALARLGAGQRERAHGAPVKGTIEGDEPGALGVPAGQLDGRLDGFRAAVAQEDLLGLIARDDGAELLHEFDLRVVTECAAPQVEEIGGLVLDGGDDFGMAVTGGANGDAGGEVEKTVTVEVFDDAAAGPSGGQGIVMHVRGGGGLVVSTDGGEGLGARRRNLDFRGRAYPVATGFLPFLSLADGQHYGGP